MIRYVKTQQIKHFFFNYYVQVNLPVPEKKTLVVVQVYDEDAKRQELISECELDITQVLIDGEADGK